jgi:hypothetical protein
MAAAAKFLIAQLSLMALGGGAAFHPSVRSMSLPARLAVASCAGAVALCLEATLLSLLGVRWNLVNLSLPLVLLSLACALRWRRLPSAPRVPVRMRRGVAIGSGLVCGISLLYLVLSFFSSAATSVDFLLFWGVKAVRFADVRGLAADFLRDPFAIHASLDYPPLVPVIQAWGCLAAGKMPWRAVPALSALWAAAAIPLLFESFRRRLGDEGAAGLAAFWTAVMSVSLAHSYSGGNAEAPLVFFESAALAFLLMEQDARESRFVATLALCGAALTKVEGLAAVAFLAAGCFVRDSGRPRAGRLGRSLALLAWPAACVSVWFLYQASRSLPVGYRPHGGLLKLYPEHLAAILGALFRAVDAGSFWIPWVLALVAMATRASVWRACAPALALTVGLLAFLVFDYLHDKNDPWERIGWTAPRVVQPALSAAVLAAGVAFAARRRVSNARVPAEPLREDLDPRTRPFRLEIAAGDDGRAVLTRSPNRP